MGGSPSVGVERARNALWSVRLSRSTEPEGTAVSMRRLIAATSPHIDRRPCVCSLALLANGISILVHAIRRFSSLNLR